MSRYYPQIPNPNNVAYRGPCHAQGSWRMPADPSAVHLPQHHLTQRRPGPIADVYMPTHKIRIVLGIGQGKGMFRTRQCNR